jgi:hypothetical protein
MTTWKSFVHAKGITIEFSNMVLGSVYLSRYINPYGCLSNRLGNH